MVLLLRKHIDWMSGSIARFVNLRGLNRRNASL